MLPLVALTGGDPAGAGPALAAAASRDPRVRRACRLLLIGCRGAAPSLTPAPAPFRPGRPDAATGLASFRAFELGARLALRGRVDALATGPVSKAAWAAAGLPYAGHNDWFRRALGLSPVMLFAAGRLRAVLATDHVPLRRVPSLAPREAARAARLAREGLRRLGLRGRLGLLGLNPHAGEGGLLGREERERLEPLVRRLRREGLSVEGPLAADAGWHRHGAGEFDALLAAYHDQGLAPLRLHAPRRLVQWSLGLPFPRTSPGHGLALGRARPDPEPTVQAVLLAASLASR